MTPAVWIGFLSWIWCKNRHLAFWSKYNFIRMTFQSKVELCLDIAHGIKVLHQCQIVHGDVKPENIDTLPHVYFFL